MSPVQVSRLRSPEGRHVGVALANGTRFDQAELVSSGRGQVRTVWVLTDGVDTLVPLLEVVDVWETAAA